MRQTIKGMIIGAVVAAFASALLAQTWTAPRTWMTDDLLTADQFNVQFRDNLLRLRADTQLTGTDALDALGCGTRSSGEVLYSDCDWGALPAGVVFDIHDDVTTAATIANTDRMPFSDEQTNGDPMRYTTAANLAVYVRGTIPTPSVFDIHDDLTSETIADTDRLAFSDEGSVGYPMRFSTAENIADYMQAAVELSANRVTSDTFNEARLGTGTASISNVLKGGSGTTAAWGPVTIDPDDIDATNTPSDGDLPFYDSSSGEVTWQPIGFGEADWSDYPAGASPNCPATAGQINPGTGLTSPVPSSSAFANVIRNPLATILMTSAEPVLNYDVTWTAGNVFTYGSIYIFVGPITDSKFTLQAQGDTSSPSEYKRITGTTIALAPGPVVVALQGGQTLPKFCTELSRIWRSS